MTGFLFLALALRASIFSCHAIPKRRVGSPVFWGLMGLVLGPLAIPFACLATAKRRD